MPAQVTRKSSRPNSFTACSTIASTSALLPTSHATASALPPPSLSLPAVSSAGSRSRSETTTAAPSEANRSEVAAPIPRAPPVTRATLPSNLIRSPPLNSRISDGQEFEQPGRLGLDRGPVQPLHGLYR